jgi:hypothetical protein
VDFLSALYVARTLVAEGRSEAAILVLNKQTLWSLAVRARPSGAVSTPAGRFASALVQFDTSTPPGDPNPKGDDDGLFGSRGSMRIWMEARTGVPVRITGRMRVPVLGKLDVAMHLESYRGTASDFVPLP